MCQLASSPVHRPHKGKCHLRQAFGKLVLSPHQWLASLSGSCEFPSSQRDWPLSWWNTFFTHFPLFQANWAQILLKLPSLARNSKLMRLHWAPNVKSYSREALTSCIDSSPFDSSGGQQFQLWSKMLENIRKGRRGGGICATLSAASKASRSSHHSSAHCCYRLVGVDALLKYKLQDTNELRKSLNLHPMDGPMRRDKKRRCMLWIAGSKAAFCRIQHWSWWEQRPPRLLTQNFTFGFEEKSGRKKQD